MKNYIIIKFKYSHRLEFNKSVMDIVMEDKIRLEYDNNKIDEKRFFF